MRLIGRTASGIANLAISKTLSERDQKIEGSRPTIEALYGVFQKLADYEDLEEQGRLIKLPCKVGDTVYCITSPYNITSNDDDIGNPNQVYEGVVASVTFYQKGGTQIRINHDGKFIGHYFMLSYFGKIVFLTREEAEAKLKEIEESEEKCL